MRVFGFALVAIAVLATGAAFTLEVFQQTSANFYRDSATTRFNNQELVDNYGRQG